MLIRADLILCEGKKTPLNEPLWSESYLNDFSEWRKVELRRGRSNLANETKMLKKTECPAGIPANHKLAMETLTKYGLFEVQVLQRKQRNLNSDNEWKKWPS